MSKQENEVVALADCLMGGGIVLLPTDTVYGLAVSPRFDESVARLFALKGRPGTVNLPIMVASAGELASLGLEVNERLQQLLQSRFVPGALTFAMGFTAGPLVPWLAGREEVAVRIPDDRRLLAVLRRTGPLLVTSANKHGVSTSNNMQDVLAQLQDKPDMAIDGGMLATVPSTLINCRHDPPVIERQGTISKAELLEFIG